MAETAGLQAAIEQAEITFNMGRAFPADDDIAIWIASLSRALNDIRTAAAYAGRQKQPEHERLYFVRVLASHIREAFKLVVVGHQERQDVQDFVQGMPQEGRDALDDLDRRLNTVFEVRRPEATVFEVVKDLRDDTFHYAVDPKKDKGSAERMRRAMRRAADEEGTYRLTDRDHRAEFADLIDVYLVHPFDGTREEKDDLARELHSTILELIGPLSTFLQAAEGQWLRERPVGVVSWPPDDR